MKQQLVKRIDERQFDSNPELVLDLMNIYLSEWKHRDAHFWNQAFAYFIATLTVIVLPLFNPEEKAVLFQMIPQCVFPIVGIIMSVLFLAIMLAYYKRSEACHSKYTEIIEKLPLKFQEENLKTKYSKSNEKEGSFPRFLIKLRDYFIVHSISEIGVIIIFSSLVVLAVIVLICTILKMQQHRIAHFIFQLFELYHHFY